MRPLLRMKLGLRVLAFRNIRWAINGLSLTKLGLLKPPRNQTIASTLSLQQKLKLYSPYFDDFKHLAEENAIVLIDFSLPKYYHDIVYYLSLSGLVSLYAFYLVLN